MLNLFETSFKRIQVGHRFSPLLYSVSDELILKYVEAVDDLNFFHRDSVKAFLSPFEGIIAPPTLASLFVLKAYRTDWTPPPGGIHLQQKFRFYGPMRPGDLLTVQAELAQKAEKSGRWFLTFISHSKNQKGEIVVWSESTSVWGDLKRKDKKNQNGEGFRIQDRDRIAIHDSDSATQRRVIGEALPILTKKITKEKIDQYEEILGIGNPLHGNAEYAKASPFKGIIAHGLMSAAYISEMMMKAFPWEWVHHVEMDIRFLQPIRPEDTVQTQGELKEKKIDTKGTYLTFDVKCQNQCGDTMLQGTTTVPIFNRQKWGN